MSTATVESVTADDLLSMPGGERLELVDGEPREKRMGAEADCIGAELIRQLGNFVRQVGRGIIFGAETGYQCFRGRRNTVRKPDVSFVAQGRLPGGRVPRGHIKVPPNLAVEVVSPNDTYAEVESKLSDYFEAGVPLVWVVNPDSRSVKVYTNGNEIPVVLKEGDQLTGGEVLPGFTTPVASIFPPRGTDDE